VFAYALGFAIEYGSPSTLKNGSNFQGLPLLQRRRHRVENAGADKALNIEQRVVFTATLQFGESPGL
jgi:hypothetical protein